MRMSAVAASAVIVLTFTLAQTPVRADEDLFHGHPIAVLIGAGPAGGYDVSARLFARHYGRFLPGNPTVIPKNVPGAGGVRLANQIYNVSPKDGTELGLFATSAALEPLLGNKQAKYETDKFTWIGNMDSDSADGCGTWRHSGIKTWEDVKNRETTFGASGPAAVAAINPKMIAALLGLKTKVIVGYTSTHNVIAAAQRGELDGSCALNLRATYSEFREQIESGELTMWITFGEKRSKEFFPNTPTIHELVQGDENRELADLIFGQNKINRAISGPPGMDAEHTTALRDAFMATMADKTFLEEAAKANVTIHPMTGEDTRAAYQAFYDQPKTVVARAMEIIGRTAEP